MATSDQPLTNRIVVSRDVAHSKPRVTGTRIMVHQVLDLLAAGKTVEEIISEDYYPDLTVDDVLSCMEYQNRRTRNHQP